MMYAVFTVRTMQKVKVVPGEDKICNSKRIFFFLTIINKIFRSAFCSLSIVGRTPSAMMITPTPRAISPQDIVRIYVPPAPPDEQKQIDARKTTTSPTKNANRKSFGGSRTSLASLERTNGSADGYASKRNSIISGDATPIRRRSLYRSDEEFSNNNFGATKSTSSSRRGSLGRKSPSMTLETNLMGCSHMARRRSSNLSNKIHMSLENISTISNTATEYISPPPKRMTSFEELAKQEKMCSTMPMQKIDVENRFTPDDDNFSVAQFMKVVNSPTATSSKFVSESSIHYTGFPSPIEYKPLKHRPLSSFDATSPSDDVSKLKYSRFYSSIDDNDECLADEKKSSDESSTSPNAKSVLSTPVNEQIPLLSSPLILDRSLIDDGIKSPRILLSSSSSPSYSNRKMHTSSTTVYSQPLLYHSPQSPDDDVNSILGPIEITQRQKSPQSDTMNSEYDERTAIERSYEFNMNPKSQTKNSNADMNKIRIKINQNQRN